MPLRWRLGIMQCTGGHMFQRVWRTLKCRVLQGVVDCDREARNNGILAMAVFCAIYLNPGLAAPVTVVLALRQFHVR